MKLADRFASIDSLAITKENFSTFAEEGLYQYLENYGEINQTIRIGEFEYMNPILKRNLTEFNISIKKTRTTDELIVFRGISGTSRDFILNVGDIITFDAFSSVSLVLDIAKIFTYNETCCLFKIYLPRGTPIIDITPFTQISELLLPLNSELKVIGKNVENISYVLEYVHDIQNDNLVSFTAPLPWNSTKGDFRSQRRWKYNPMYVD